MLSVLSLLEETFLMENSESSWFRDDQERSTAVVREMLLRGSGQTDGWADLSDASGKISRRR